MLGRRSFVLGTSSALLAHAATGFVRADPTNTGTLRLGFSTYGMKTMPVTQALETLADIGYRSVEIAAMQGWPSEPKLLSEADRKEIAALLTQRNLSLDAMMLNIRPHSDPKQAAASLEEIRATAALGRDLTGKQCPPIETVLGGRPDQWDDIKEELARGLSHWAKEAEREKVVIAIKAHVSGAMSTPDRAVWLRDRVGSDAIQLTYDYSHFGLQDLPLEPSIERMLPHTVFVHIKDFVKQDKGFRFVLPGKTDFDYARYVNLLTQGGYKGSVCVEVSGQVWNAPDYDPVQAARFCHQKLGKLFK